MEKNIFLIGTGQMAVDYAKVLNALGQPFTVIGRGLASATKFEETTGIKPITGGIEAYLFKNRLPGNAYVIIATGIEALMTTLLKVLQYGATMVLVEKPAAISIDELISNEDALRPYFDKVFVAYNRRFYASVIEAQKIIEKDGGLQSMHFEFTEWAHKIEPLQKAPGIKGNWFFANSSHVVNLSFYLAGDPVDWQTYSKPGKLTWHGKTNFTGAGITNKGVLFSYLSNWESAGRWGIELLTKNRRIYLRPLESLSVQQKGSLVILDHLFDDSMDKQFKPGLQKQIEAFLNDRSSSLLGIKEHVYFSKTIYSKILS